MRPMEDWCATALARPAEQPAIEFDGSWVSWGQLRRLADSLGTLVDDSGAAAGAPVAFVPRNHPSAIAALLGLIARRRTIRMIYAFQSPAAIARDVERLRPAILVAAAEDCVDPVLSVLKAHGIAGIAMDRMNAVALPGLEQSRPCADETSVSAQPVIEILTSGTTGPPKQFGIGYPLIAKLVASSPASDFSSVPPTLLFFPLGNISGIYATLPPLLRGQRAVLIERFNVADWHRYILRYRPETSGMPPAGVQMVLDANIPPADLACLKRLGTGAAPLDPTVHRAFEARYGVPILLSYGATEFGGPVTAMTAELHAVWGDRKFGSVGRALPAAQLRIVDPDAGTALPTGREGVLEVISPRIGPDWIRTSDIAVIDEDGFLFHRGRNDGAIIRGGFKILPETIERALMLHPSISAAAAVGIPDARLGQVPAVAIQLKPDASQPGETELEAHLRKHLPATHVPAHWRIVDSLPRTPSMKVERPALRRLFVGGDSVR